MAYKPTGRKPGRPKKVHAGGRPQAVTPEKLRKLEEAFAIGCTDIEACLFADLKSSTFYDYQRENPGFSVRKQELKQNPILRARTKVVNEIDNDTNTAKWYLERRAKDEFAPNRKIEAEITNIEDIINAISG